MDTTQCVGGSHSSSPSVKSWLQHLNLFPDYIFVTLSTPFPSISSISPPPTLLSLPFPSLESKLSTSSLVPLLQLLHHNIRLISPHLLSQNLSFLLPQLTSLSTPPLPPGPGLFAPLYLHRSTRWFVLKLYIWQLGRFFFFLQDIILTSRQLLRPGGTQKKDKQGVKGN